jgi:hypothetical protein
MREPYRTPAYILKAQKDYRERNRETLAEKARLRYAENKEAVLLRKQELRDAKRAEDGLPPIIRKVVDSPHRNNPGSVAV